MRPRLRSVVFLLLFTAVALFPFRVLAEKPVPRPELETLLKQIEHRHYRWIAFRADVILFFVAPGSSKQTMCGGELLYQRLDERMLLSCYDSNKDLVFVFRTLDRRFDLYMPSQNTLYHGSVFDLEDSPEIESHLKLIDLYRALKPGMFDLRYTEVDTASDVKVSLNVFGSANGGSYLSRKLYVTPAGDVVGEVFFNPEGQALTEIQRYDFQEIDARAGAFKSVYFPKKVTIISPQSGKNTAIFFNKIKPLDAIDSYEFLLRIRKGTQEVFLKEVDPRFSVMPLKEAAVNKPGNEKPGAQAGEDNEVAEGSPTPIEVAGKPYDPAAITELPGQPVVVSSSGSAAEEIPEESEKAVENMPEEPVATEEKTSAEGTASAENPAQNNAAEDTAPR